MRAVVDDARHQGPVDVALDEVDDDFLTDAGNVLGAPGGAGTRVGNTDPGTGVVILVGPAVRMVLFPLPVELDLDAPVFVGEDLFAFGTDDGGGGQAFGRGFLVSGADVLGDDGDVPADGGKRVSIGRSVLGG